MVLTSRERKLIRSLNKKKYRQEYGLFVVEGQKAIEDLLVSDYEIDKIIVAENWNGNLNFPGNVELVEVSDEQFKSLSFQRTPQNIMALVKLRENTFDYRRLAMHDLVLALDDIQDPGNMGTILRIADWFGIPGILASPATVDVYNPKVVQASMGAVFRVPVMYVDLLPALERLEGLPVYGTFMDGENIYATRLSSNGVIIMGNEGNGISSGVAARVNKRLSIPSFNPGNHIESLNVAIATGIVVSEFRRRSFG